MVKTILAGAVVLLISAPGCGDSAQYSRTSRHAFRAKAPSCAFDIMLARPERQIVEIGVLESLRCGSGVCRNASELRRLVAPYVCRAGGDGVIVMVNGMGFYVKAVVVKYKQDQQPPRQTPPRLEKP